jgi:hypothetical protein
MEESLLLEEKSAWICIQASFGRNRTYHWNTPRHTDESNCREYHDKENDPQGAFSRVFSIFPVIGYYSRLWAKVQSVPTTSHSPIVLELTRVVGEGMVLKACTGSIMLTNVGCCCDIRTFERSNESSVSSPDESN